MEKLLEEANWLLGNLTGMMSKLERNGRQQDCARRLRAAALEHPAMNMTLISLAEDLDWASKG